MSRLEAKFSGLFTLVRHIDPPDMRKGSPSTSEPMTVAFVHDDGGGMGGPMAGHKAGAPMHKVALHVPKAALSKEAEAALAILPGIAPPDMQTVSFALEGWRVHLPVDDAGQQPVHHEPDEPLGVDEPLDDRACKRVGEGGPWAPLTRLPTLNHLTGLPLAVDAHTPDLKNIDVSVLLSGGKIACVRSEKALCDAFFEFFTEKETLLIQPAVEDVLYTYDSTSADAITIGFSRSGSPGITRVTLTETPGQAIVFRNLPPENAPKPTNLNHFQNHYKLMGQKSGPFVRMVARCTLPPGEPKLVHTMPGITKVPKPPVGLIRGFSVDTCSCLSAQAYAGLLKK